MSDEDKFVFFEGTGDIARSGTMPLNEFFDMYDRPTQNIPIPTAADAEYLRKNFSPEDLKELASGVKQQARAKPKRPSYSVENGSNVIKPVFPKPPAKTL